jgi:hypothetical protein
MHRTIPVFLLMIALTHAEWTPPPDPDPQAILQEAKADARAQNYEAALAKQVWFHQHALAVRPSLYGVRLSFALSAWVDLGKAYPPALEKLQSTRAEHATKVRDGSGGREDFHDFEAISRTLKEDGPTKELFVWLDANKPELAKQVYDLAQPALINAAAYQLCGRYLDPDKAFQRLLKAYQTNRQMAEDPKFGARMQAFGEKSFANGTATLVALLVRNERLVDAERIMAAAVNEWNDPQFHEQLESAKQGKVPAPWP